MFKDNQDDSGKTHRRNKIARNRSKDQHGNDEYRHINKSKKELKHKKDSMKEEELWEDWQDYV
jgi:hypothetical protein